jgi:hypothetical protein
MVDPAIRSEPGGPTPGALDLTTLAPDSTSNIKDFRVMRFRFPERPRLVDLTLADAAANLAANEPVRQAYLGEI